jgi:peptidoglycan/LPS O-acetylase OafA/YrhL
MVNNGNSAGSDRLLGLEAIRFIAAFSVLIWHYQFFAFVTDLPVNFVKEQQPFYSILRVFYDYGAWGVHIFWCISGFVFFWKYGRSIPSGQVSSKDFIIRRLSRLYPLHLVTLLLVAFLQSIYFRSNDGFFVFQDNTALAFGLQLFLASDWGFLKGFSFNGPIWSISVEVLVYFVFFVLMRRIGRSAAINVVVVSACALARAIGISHPAVDCLIFFYLGGFSAIVARAAPGARNRVLSTAAFVVMCATLIVVLFFRLYESRAYLYLGLMVFSPALLLWLSRAPQVGARIQSIVKAAGSMTYASYLLHFPVQLMIVNVLQRFGIRPPVYDGAFLAMFLAIVLSLAYLTYRYFEAPMQKVLRGVFAAS